MSTPHARSQAAPQRTPRNWIADTLIVAGVLAFGYFAITLETARQQGMSDADPATLASPLELLR